ncbi:unnamed protein product [Brachionus calyciflorus]|uniref:Uncharacterized protein n=1 Tax=Brachionus calyciflorus TaxID=104777 RepID=A0A814K4I2_9BILA|nr:unnamed protein product [Brachionus calyciflorus]
MRFLFLVSFVLAVVYSTNAKSLSPVDSDSAVNLRSFVNSDYYKRPDYNDDDVRGYYTDNDKDLDFDFDFLPSRHYEPRVDYVPRYDLPKLVQKRPEYTLVRLDDLDRNTDAYKVAIKKNGNDWRRDNDMKIEIEVPKTELEEILIYDLTVVERFLRDYSNPIKNDLLNTILRDVADLKDKLKAARRQNF